MINEHRKLIFDKFYAWVDSNIDSLPTEVTDVTAEIWNLEEEYSAWKAGYARVKVRLEKINKTSPTENSNIHFVD
jgi:hypothetical protein